MEKIWVKDVKEGERVKSLFLVARKAVLTAKSGKSYLAATFQDKTGELEARAFERLEELTPIFEEKDYVEVEGPIGVFQGKPQVRIESISKADPAALDAAEFVWAPPPEPREPKKEGLSEADEVVWRELAGLVGAVSDPHIKSLIQAFLEDEDVVHRLRRAPAAKSVHHAYAGGLLEHTVSCLKLAHRISDHYPQVDRDLLVAGAFFHDLGKIRELSFERNVEYTDEGRLIGHLVMTAQWIHDKARRVGVPRELEQHVVHIVLAHHGRLEYGSPKLPMTLEALLTHEIDELDSRVNSWLNLMARDGGSRRWTDSSNIYEQHIWRGTLPTVQAEKKGPAPEVMTPVIYVPRDNASGQQGGGESRRAKKTKRERRPEGGQRQSSPPAQAHVEQTPGDAAAAAAGGAQPAQAVAEGAHRPERSERPPRERRGPPPGGHSGGPGHGGAPGGGRGPGGDRGAPGERPRRYMGPRLPGDSGPRPEKKQAALTHNPFAALAQKVKGEDQPAEQSAPVEVADGSAPQAPVEAAPAPALQAPEIQPAVSPEQQSPGTSEPAAG
jgi:3'-5' exoribonuclease